jgi:STE24 endopeptidase
LNLRALDLTAPAEFADVYAPEEYLRGQEYTRATTTFGWFRASVDLIMLVGFWLAGGFGWWDGIVRGLEWPAIAAGVVYLGGLFVAQALVDLPFDVYATFVLEQRVGLNRTSWRTYLADRLKGTALAAVLGIPLLAGVLWLFGSGSRWAWVVAWGAGTLLMVILQMVMPTWVMPLFNRFTPLADGTLREALVDIARRAGFPVRDIVVMDASRRSARSNAFLTGFGGSRRIVLFDTLIASLSVPQLTAVLAHELGHARRRHILQGLIVSVVGLGVSCVLAQWFLANAFLARDFKVALPSTYTGLVLFAVALGPLSAVVGVGANALSRHNERAADEFAARLTGRPGDLAGAVRVLARTNLANLTPHPLYVVLNYSHPPLAERVRALRAPPAAE